MSASHTDAKKDQFVGNVKDTVGGTVGNESLQAEGKTQNTAGHAQGVGAKVQGAYDQASGAVKGAINSLTGNNSGEAANKVQEKKGEAQKNFNA